MSLLLQENIAHDNCYFRFLLGLCKKEEFFAQRCLRLYTLNFPVELQNSYLLFQVRHTDNINVLMNFNVGTVRHGTRKIFKKTKQIHQVRAAYV